MKNVIRVHQLNKQYAVYKYDGSLTSRLFGKKTIIEALKNVSLEIDQGESVAILGPNGAGKSTLIKVLTGILTPNSGEVSCLGFHPSQNRMIYTKKIGVVMGQKSLLHFDLPVIDSLILFSRIYDLTKSQEEERISQLGDIFNIKDFIYTPVRQLSLGQRMRCEIVASLIHRPEIIFLDEPTIGLDLPSKLQLLLYLKKLRQETKVTILLATHSLQEVEYLNDRVVIINNGNIEFDDSILNLRKNTNYRRVEFVVKNLDESLANLSKKWGLEIREGSNSIQIDESSHRSFASAIMGSQNVEDIYITAPTIEECIKEFI